MEVESKPVMRSVIKKGLAPVDSECPSVDTHHVYTEGRDIWDVMLNQTNIQNNNNKYYLIQLLQSDSNNSFAVWMRWGRVGYSGSCLYIISYSSCSNILDTSTSSRTK